MSDDLAAFILARLDEDEAAAKARQGIFPSPGVEDSGAVWLHVKRGGNAVVVHYRQPVEGYGDMADLKAWADAEQGWTQDRVLREVEAKRKILALHSPEPGQHPDFCGHDLRGLPCPTLRHLAAVYSDHPDYDPSWAPEKGD